MKKALLIFFIGLLLIVVGITVGVFIYQDAQSFMQTGVKAEGTIKDIQVENIRETDSDGNYITRYDYTVMITYKTEDGTILTSRLGYYDSSMKQGDSIEIFYNPDNPAEIRTGDTSTFPLFFGGIFTLVGLPFFIYGLIMILRKMSW